MIDISNKFNTLRYAKAEGTLSAPEEIIERVKNKTVPKGEVLEVARAAGINTAKRTSDFITFCHPMPVDWIGVSYKIEKEKIRVTAEVKAVWKTGVEMEAITAVSSALLNMYDMLKPLTDDISFTDIHLVKKKGGKSDFKENFENPITAAVLVISDSTFAGTREDKSGKIINEFLAKQNIEVKVYEILPDDLEKIQNRLKELSDKEKIELVITTGGTGFGPKDLTPEATLTILEKQIPGVTETIRRHGKERTPYAMLSRETAGIRGKSVIINLPGSSKGAKESMESLFPGLLHIYPMMNGGGH